MVDIAARTPPVKLVDRDEVAAAIGPGADVAFGGGGLQRKPLSLAKDIVVAGIGDLDITSFLAGPEVDLLIGLGRVRSLRFAYVGFDALGLAPNYRRFRQSGQLSAIEMSEGMFLAGVEAAARRLPFYPSRSGTVGDVLDLPDSPARRFDCPITGEPLVAVPAISPDVFLLHVDIADRYGNLVIDGDAFLDTLLARSGARVYASAERVVPDLAAGRARGSTVISRAWVTGVCEIPGGSGFTGMFPHKDLDWDAAVDYQANATDPAWLATFTTER